MDSPTPLYSADQLGTMRGPIHIYRIMGLGSQAERVLDDMDSGEIKGSKRLYRASYINFTLGELARGDEPWPHPATVRYWRRRGWITQNVGRWNDNWDVVTIHHGYERHL